MKNKPKPQSQRYFGNAVVTPSSREIIPQTDRSKVELRRDLEERIAAKAQLDEWGIG